LQVFAKLNGLKKNLIWEGTSCFPKNIMIKDVRIKAIMDVTEKLEEFLKSKDEKYITSLKEYFFKCVHVTSNEEGEFVVQGLDSKQMQELLTEEYFIECLVAIPSGFTKFLHLIDEFIDPISEAILHLLDNYFVNQLDSDFLKELESELDVGSDKALLALANEVLKTLGKDDISSPKREYEILRNLLVNLNGNIIKLIMQATLSIHLKLFGSAKMQIQHALKLLINKVTSYKLQHSVIEITAIKNKAKMSGEKGSKKRWALKSKVREEAFRLRDEMKKNGKYINDLQASKSLTNALCLFAIDIGDPFTEPFTAQVRIYKWFREEKKKHIVA
jgi:hypothetical protein